jgi:hypothetical protein
MAGPCFTLLYRLIVAKEHEALGEWIDSIADGPVAQGLNLFRFSLDEVVVPRISRAKDERHRKQTCEYLVSIGDVPFFAKAERAAIEKKFGYVPAQMITACAGCRDAFNVDGLLFIQKGLIDRFGGWFVFEDNRLPLAAAALKNGLVTVNVANYEAFFGPGPVDPAYIAQYEEFVPRKTLYFIDARLTGFRHLDP